ncbi:hypothetical protein CLOBOL_02743 [Enterocloster bolteae ATCC BAA-613]|uniref:Uncharacterized protein n=1 Tax=Enterocloster bolteae (strain ATCC BAA-613 / DSM 15670 / CCUG 46953 / JCM 12243 / WAL 16351) TaxID=411902 RepID=A8RQI4_ENTBW|nr:hypothetical protein CLOBOL_02743 [Enterocloster bolteae ATCC BAA-613]
MQTAARSFDLFISFTLFSLSYFTSLSIQYMCRGNIKMLLPFSPFTDFIMCGKKKTAPGLLPAPHG